MTGNPWFSGLFGRFRLGSVERALLRGPLTAVLAFGYDAASLIIVLLSRPFLPLSSSDLLIFRHFRHRWPPERASRWLLPDARSTSHFESGGAAFTI